MKKVLISTTNKDKFKIVSRLFRETIFPEDEYEILSISKDMNIPDEKETGSNVERARQKALNAFNHLKEYNFDYIVGLDDAVVIKGRVEPNIREYMGKILYENYLDDGEEYSFFRAYCIIDKDMNIYETNLNIPEVYHPLKEDYIIEKHTYPLSHVSYPIGYDKPICELNEEEETTYYLKYTRKGLMDLNIKKH